MTVTQYSRKLESTGRIMIPIRLREQMGLVPGHVYNFFIHEENGKRYICMECPALDNQLSLEEAKRIIEANGMKISQDK